MKHATGRLALGLGEPEMPGDGAGDVVVYGAACELKTELDLTVMVALVLDEVRSERSLRGLIRVCSLRRRGRLWRCRSTFAQMRSGSGSAVHSSVGSSLPKLGANSGASSETRTRRSACG